MRTNSRKHIMAVARQYAIKQEAYRDNMLCFEQDAAYRRERIEHKRRMRKLHKTMRRATRVVRDFGAGLAAGFSKFTAAVNLFAGQVLHVQDGMVRGTAEYFKMDTGHLEPSLKVEHEDVPGISFDEPPYSPPIKQIPPWKGRGK